METSREPGDNHVAKRRPRRTAGALAEIPITTTVMFRSILDIAALAGV